MSFGIFKDFFIYYLLIRNSHTLKHFKTILRSVICSSDDFTNISIQRIYQFIFEIEILFVMFFLVIEFSTVLNQNMQQNAILANSLF